MNQQAKDYIKSNTLDLESKNRMDSTGYVQYAVSVAKAYGAIALVEDNRRQRIIEKIAIAEDEMRQKAIGSFRKNCPCWSRFQRDRKCDECSYLKDFCKQLY